ncbi:uncharacterized protein LOC129302755 [Prosopis cineraria]|uniref:uncharacterized protein LOC129302755 n=1 Tax=Prosopis cineraria TaxID=364024 RepID=UPI00240F357F|nr:uncharacterized protein LOC129302755 [Prosopis cineraria]
MVEDKVFLKVSPMKGVMRFEKKGKLSSRYVGPFEILERIGAVAYRLALPPEWLGIHLVFHVSMLRKYLYDPSHVIETQGIQIDSDLAYEEILVAILDKQVKKLRSKEVALLIVVGALVAGSFVSVRVLPYFCVILPYTSSAFHWLRLPKMGDAVLELRRC